MNLDMSFFESIARSLEDVARWIDSATKGEPAKEAPEPTNYANFPLAYENALKKYKIDADLYTSIYPSPFHATDATILQMQTPDVAMDEITVKFQRSVYVSKNADLVASQKLYQRAKEVHLSNTAEYTRHLARLDGLDPKQKSAARARAWKFIEQANLKLASMDTLVRDFEIMMRPKGDAVQKILEKLGAHYETVEECGQSAMLLLVQEIQSLEAFMGSMSGVFLHVFSFMSAAEVSQCRLVSGTWNDAITTKRVLSFAIQSPVERCRMWQHAIQRHRSHDGAGMNVNYDYAALVSAAYSDTSNRHHLIIDADVRRTTFIRRENLYPSRSTGQPPSSRTTKHRRIAASSAEDATTLADLHAKLSRILHAYCQLDPSVGYCHGMTFLAAGILSCLGYNEAATFDVLVAAMLDYDMAEMFRLPELPGTKRRMHQLDKLVRIHLPTMGKCLLQHKIHPQMYSSGWVMSLFLNESQLSPATTCVLLDEFILGGWPAMFRIYLGLLSVHASHVVTPHFNRSLQALVLLPKQLESSLMAVLEEGSISFTHATSSDALEMLAAHYDPTTSFMDYF
ncbi:Aste57867_13350 [Aphanomyces stellatus]|uniref:Aste57867_13350 protein n=1 Tax=Aphanomyces stellatus TaxID=120398 RepID=A0A485KY73_9STRA|nr:hypothetical protein As57867_013300 [Aphanomyces stellatus]VFT90189.1 Aste57867_13350 [Aphanomyces stellatus]